MVTGAFILKLLSLVVSLYGVIVGIVIWFVPEFGLGAVTTGIAVIFLNALILIFEVRPSKFFVTYLKFLTLSGGRAALLITLGLIYAGPNGLGIASWVIFWVLAGLYIILYFAGETVIPDPEDGLGFKHAPEEPPPQPQQQQQQATPDGATETVMSPYQQVP
jgi:hypothetical protein